MKSKAEILDRINEYEGSLKFQDGNNLIATKAYIKALFWVLNCEVQSVTVNPNFKPVNNDAFLQD